MARQPGTLWIVATPIGTLGDLSPRACEILDNVDLILAEDTRRTRNLLGHVDIAPRRRLVSLHEHNEPERLAFALSALADGRSIALVSDAGTPVLSDPGFLLVREARAAGATIASVPGPSAFTAALAASGQPPLPATLVGFLPARAGARRSRIAELAGVDWSLVVLLSPHRLSAELEALADGLGADRPATLLVELSKLHERALSGTLGELARSDEADAPRGEYVVVVGPTVAAPSSEADPMEIRRTYRDALASGQSRKDAMKAVALTFGLPRRAVFDVLVDHEKNDP